MKISEDIVSLCAVQTYSDKMGGIATLNMLMIKADNIIFR